MKYLKLIAIFILLTSCSTNKNFLTDLEKIGLKGKVKHIQFNHQINTKNATEKQKEEEVFINTEFFFNINGMITEQRLHHSNGLTQIYGFIHDEKNLLISKNYYNSSREIITKSIFENVLNDKGKLITQTEFKALANSPNDLTNLTFNLFPYEITEYLYDGHGNLSQLNQYQNMTPWKNITLFKDGMITKNSIVDITNDNLISSSNYNCVEFDQKNNCTKYKITEDNQTESYINAKIEYYE